MLKWLRRLFRSRPRGIQFGSTQDTALYRTGPTKWTTDDVARSTEAEQAADRGYPIRRRRSSAHEQTAHSGTMFDPTPSFDPTTYTGSATDSSPSSDFGGGGGGDFGGGGSSGSWDGGSSDGGGDFGGSD